MIMRHSLIKKGYLVFQRIGVMDGFIVIAWQYAKY